MIGRTNNGNIEWRFKINLTKAFTIVAERSLLLCFKNDHLVPIHTYSRVFSKTETFSQNTATVHTQPAFSGNEQGGFYIRSPGWRVLKTETYPIRVNTARQNVLLLLLLLLLLLFLGGREGQLGRANPRRVPGKKLLKMFEIFIPKIAVNASIFKKLAHIYGELFYCYFFRSISP